MLKRFYCGCIAPAVLFVFVFSAFGNKVVAEGVTSYRGEVGSFTNDFFGDGHDRWQSGSYQRSYYSEGYRAGWFNGIELRARSQIVTPWVSSKQPEGDVPYSTLLGAGVFLHDSILGFETRIGGEAMLLGDASGAEAVQRAVHDGLGMDGSFDPDRDDLDRVEDGLELRFEAEFGRVIDLNERAIVRPYAELVFGADEAATAGVDLVFGPMSSAEIWTRDIVTGRLLTPQVDQIRGLSWVVGWDARAVESSVHLPEGSAVELEPIQFRSRLGLQSSLGYANFFIGQAWLSPRFVGQAEAQRVGMLSMSFNF